MVLCAFAMHGRVRPDFATAPVEYLRDGPPPAHAPARTAPPPAPAEEPGGRLWQGPMPEGHRGTAERTLLAGWLADVPDLAALQDRLDAGGREAVRALRGDFTIAHLSPDGGTLRLYRGVTSMIPLFWRADDDGLRWATDPLRLLDGPPTLADLELDLLPMIVAEHGFPHDRSWFRGMRRLPAGTCLTLRSGGRPTLEPFDALTPVPDPPRGVREAARGLRERLGRACDRMLPDRDPVMLMLSGGMDSGAAAVELGRASADPTGFHFTMDFPGFEDDRKAAELVAAATGLDFLPYDMAAHVLEGGDYIEAPAGGALPQTHTPLRSMAAAGREAHARGVRFVVSGLAADQILAADVHRSLFELAGWSALNPLAVGEPIWQLLRRAATGSLWASAPLGWRDYPRYLRALLRRDPTVALPDRDSIVHPIGLTDEAAAQVTRALRQAAAQAARQLAAAPSVSSVFELNGFLDSPNLQAAALNDLLPNGCLPATPYFDRDVVEYAVALPTGVRAGFGYGTAVDKLALRVAYAGAGLPRQIASRTQQAILAAFAATYVNRNLERCRSLLGDDSRLRALGVLDGSWTRAALTERNAHRHGAEIARLCVLENWLRILAP